MAPVVISPAVPISLYLSREASIRPSRPTTRLIYELLRAVNCAPISARHLTTSICRPQIRVARERAFDIRASVEIGVGASIENESSTIGTNAGNAIHDQCVVLISEFCRASLFFTANDFCYSPNVFQREIVNKNFGGLASRSPATRDITLSLKGRRFLGGCRERIQRNRAVHVTLKFAIFAFSE